MMKAKNVFKQFGIIGFIVLVGITIMACDLNADNHPSLQGEWVSGLSRFIFTGNEFEHRQSSFLNIRGTFTYTVSHITFTVTHVWNSSQNAWIETTGAELSPLRQNMFRYGNPTPYNIESDLLSFPGSGHGFRYRRQ